MRIASSIIYRGSRRRLKLTLCSRPHKRQFDRSSFDASPLLISLSCAACFEVPKSIGISSLRTYNAAVAQHIGIFSFRPLAILHSCHFGRPRITHQKHCLNTALSRTTILFAIASPMAKATVSDREVSAGIQTTRPFECSWEDCPKVQLQSPCCFSAAADQIMANCAMAEL